MSVLLRHPATVPALFSRSVDPELQSDRVRAPWYRVSRGSPLALTVVWAAVILVEVPIVRAAAAAVGLALPH